MAMLAEPKRRKKWSLNPRGKMWVNDETKIGQKLLEKMGWSKGKGLGRAEQGELEPIRVHYKNDAEGVGYKAKDDQWIAHHDEFSAILGQLNGANAPAEVPESIPVKSLEVRSKSSKARVHYHKFTRGKDLSRYSATDLACILGKRTGTQQQPTDDASQEDQEGKEEGEEKEKEEEKKKPETETDGSSDVEHSHGVTTIRKGNINDYFASKMAALKAKNQTVALAPPAEETLDGTEGDEEEEEEEGAESDGRNDKRRVRFNEELNVVKEFCSKKKIIDGSCDDTDETPQLADKSLRKKKKRKGAMPGEEDGEAVILESIAGEGVELEASPEDATRASLKKTKKKKKEKEKKKKTTTTTSMGEEEEEEEKAEDIVQAIETDPAEMPAAAEEGEGEGGKAAEEPPSSNEENKKKKKKKAKKTSKKKEEEGKGYGGGSWSQEEEQSAGEKVIEEAPAAAVQGADKEEKKKKKRKREPDGTEDEGVQRTESPGTDHHQEEEKEQEDPGPSSEKKRKADDDDDGDDDVDDDVAAAGGAAAAQDPEDRSGGRKRYRIPDLTLFTNGHPAFLKRTKKRYELVDFEQFKGANLYRIAGYGNNLHPQ